MSRYGGGEVGDPRSTSGGTDGATSAAGEVASDGGEVDLVVVTMTFDASDMGSLVAILSKYVVLTRMEPGCRNVDMVVSETKPNRVLIIEKWDSPEHQRTHFDGATMVEMARSCGGILTRAPDVDLWQSMSAHDLR